LASQPVIDRGAAAPKFCGGGCANGLIVIPGA
jgi:hypothetical protein